MFIYRIWTILSHDVGPSPTAEVRMWASSIGVGRQNVTKKLVAPPLTVPICAKAVPIRNASKA